MPGFLYLFHLIFRQPLDQLLSIFFTATTQVVAVFKGQMLQKERKGYDATITTEPSVNPYNPHQGLKRKL